MKKEKAYFAGGCFWCLEAAFKLVPGVKKVTSGYAGGKTENPSYSQVSTGKTDHAETVEIDFEAQKVSYPQLLKLFFLIHDPSRKDRQGADLGTQYRSAIFYANERQRVEAQKAIEALKKSQQYSAVFTELVPLEHFWPAEEYHQDYFEKHPNQAYCQFAVRPKVEKTKKFLKKEQDGQKD